MKRDDFIHMAKTLGMGLLSFGAYISAFWLFFDVVHQLRGVLVPTAYPWWATAYCLFIICYFSEQWHISSITENPEQMAVILVINCTLLYLYW